MELKAIFDEKRRMEIREGLRSGKLELKYKIPLAQPDGGPEELAKAAAEITVRRTIPAEELAKRRVREPTVSEVLYGWGRKIWSEDMAAAQKDDTKE